MATLPSALDPLPKPQAPRSPFAPGAPAVDATESRGLFEDEVDLAIERSGGVRAVESRLQAASDARRGERRAGFENYRASRGRAESERSSDGADAVDSRGSVPGGAAPTEQGRASRNRGQESAGGSRQEPEAERPAGRAKSPALRPEKATEATPASVARSNAGVVAAAPGAPGAVTGIGGAAPALAPSGAPTASAVGTFRSPIAQAELGSRPATASKAPLPQAPDPELIERAAEVLRQLRVHLRGVRGSQEVRVHLSPQELGQLSIRMRLEEGTLTTHVRVESAQTLELLERQAPELRSLLQQQGFDAERIELELFDGGGADADMRQGSRGADTNGGHAALDGTPDAETTVSPDTNRSILADDRVDTYA